MRKPKDDFSPAIKGCEGRHAERKRRSKFDELHGAKIMRRARQRKSHVGGSFFLARLNSPLNMHRSTMRSYIGEQRA
jgi:hypothetical protein